MDCKSCFPANGSSASASASCRSASRSSIQMPAAGPEVTCRSGVSHAAWGFQPVVMMRQTRHTTTNRNTSTSSAWHSLWTCSAVSGLSARRQMASTPHTAGHIRYIKVGASPSSVERRIIRYAATPGSQPSQNSSDRVRRLSCLRSAQKVQPPSSTSTGRYCRMSMLRSVSALARQYTTDHRANPCSQVSKNRRRLRQQSPTVNTADSSAGLASILPTSAACAASRARRSPVVKLYWGSFRIIMAREISRDSGSPRSTKATKASPQTTQLPKNTHAPLPRRWRSSTSIPIKYTGAAKILWGKARKLKQAHTAPSAAQPAGRPL